MHPNASVDEIAAWLDGLLDVKRYASEEQANGLLHRAGDGVSKFAVAVNTSLATILAAAKSGVQLMVVHHASWEHIDLHLRDEKMQALSMAGISLYGAHAALDCAGRGVGNGWVLADLLGIDVEDTFAEFHGGHCGVIGSYAGGFGDLIATASRTLGVQVEAHEHAKAPGRVAIVTGAGGMTSDLDAAHRLGARTYITGEGSMYTRMFARETGMNLVFGTHHATEAPGIRALGERIGEHTALPWEFLADTPDVF